MRHAVRDPSLRATVLESRPLRYADGPSLSLDRPAHVRAGSALAWCGGRLVVVQDDASFLAVVDERTVEGLPLPSDHGVRLFDDERGNKAQKLDLEAAVALANGTLIAFGSGSTAARERLAILEPDGRTRLVWLPGFYERLRAERSFSGSELNLEGATLVGSTIWLFQRGNGAPTVDAAPCDATACVALDALLAHLAGGPAPALEAVTQYDLGEVAGVRLTFTDGASRGDSLYYLAAAEASPDAVRDGPVAGVAIGRLGAEPRFALLEDRLGPFTGKAEGLAFDPADSGRAYVVVDRDDPSVAAELCTIALTGPW